VEERICKECGATKPLELFVGDAKSAGGYRHVCKACKRAQMRDYHKRPERRKANYKRQRTPGVREINKQSMLKWRQENPEAARAMGWVNSRLQAGILERGPCEVCGHRPASMYHEDYTKPHEVRWLCREHNPKFLRRRKQE
jgi:hypothetical protein